MTPEPAAAPTSATAGSAVPALDPEGGSGARGRGARIADALIRSVGPVVLALLVAALLLVLLGRSPVDFYSTIWKSGVEGQSWQDSATRMAPLLMVALGLIVAFRANVWNLGYDGQFLLAAVVIMGLAYPLRDLPIPLMLAILFIVAGVVGALWTLLPALLKAYFDVNEIVSTLMTSFLGLSVANILIKGPFQDPGTQVAQTRALDFDALLPAIPGTRVHIGLIVAFVAVLVTHYVLTYTSIGLRLAILGANRPAAVHAGIDVRRVIITSFLCSGMFIGFAAGLEILGVWGYVRADWNPGFGTAVVPLVFLARLNALAVVPFIAFYAVLSIGGDAAAQKVQLPTDFLFIVIGLILLFMSITEYLGARRALGESYLPPGLRARLKRGGDDG